MSANIPVPSDTQSKHTVHDNLRTTGLYPPPEIQSLVSFLAMLIENPTHIADNSRTVDTTQEQSSHPSADVRRSLIDSTSQHRSDRLRSGPPYPRIPQHNPVDLSPSQNRPSAQISSLTHRPPTSSVHPSQATPNPSSTRSQTLLPPPPTPIRQSRSPRPIRSLPTPSDQVTSLPGAHLVPPPALPTSQRT
jgi:hypothetical protein